MSAATPSPVPWGQFTADPRRAESAPLRASDHDRDVALGVLGEAYADGRLTKEEYDERSDLAAGARTLGDLPALIRDLVPDRPPGSHALATPDQLDEQAEARWRHQRREAVTGAIVVAVICWTIWALTGAGFPWPLFPTFFVAMRIPQVLTQRAEIVAKERARLERKHQKALDAERRRRDRW
jgi:DUF1707 SHOCT-like domain